ncbi:MAG TPA: CopG family transcriptional regulator [Chthoniobacterales bacterium]
MRTTLTLDPDVACALERMRAQRGLSLKQAVNEALRKGLETRGSVQAPRTFVTRVVDHGPPLAGNFDDIAAVLAHIEEDRLK